MRKVFGIFGLLIFVCVVTVIVTYPGADPETMESKVADPIEQTINSLSGIKSLRSTNMEGTSQITIEFELARSIEEATNDVRDRVSRIRGSLPGEADDPIVEKVDTNAQPIVWLALSSERHSNLELSDVADRVLKERMQRLLV